MSEFIVPSISIDSLEDLHSVKEYLRDLTKKVRFLSQNVDENNFDPEAYSLFYENGDEALELSYSLDGYRIELKGYGDDVVSKLEATSKEIDLLVAKGSITNEINISKEKIYINGNRLIVKSSNFTLDASGNLTMKGTINATAGNFGNYRIGSDSSGSYVYNNSGQITAAHLSGTDINVSGTLDMVTDTYINGCSIDMSNCSVQTSRSTYLGWFYSDDVEVQGNYVYCNCANIVSSINVTKRIYCYDVWSIDEGIAWSDRRLKKDIERIDEGSALAFLIKLRPVSYELKEHGDGVPHNGLIAQEVLETGDPFHIVTEEDGYYGIHYEALDAVIAAALKAQKRELEELNV
ncbi:MAG TPA: hypothetical protein DD632_03780, partial [Oribacterium sp.]|nr:hypothetical protein [Oribacterium sp.]